MCNRLRCRQIVSICLLCIITVFSVSCNGGWSEFSEQSYRENFLKAQRKIEPENIFNNNSDYIIVIGDVQEYTDDNYLLQYLNYTFEWIRVQAENHNNISCVLQTGDLTWGNTMHQYNNFEIALGHLGKEVLLIPVTGNHDYDWGSDFSTMEIADRESTHINEISGLEKFDNSIIWRYEENKRDNVIVPITCNGETFYVIALEFGPRKEVVEWARQIVSQNQEKKFILMTHEFLTKEGERIDNGSYAEKHMPNISTSTPEYIWQNLVKSNDNIICVICGHNGFCKYLMSKNDYGRDVPQILFNLQYQKNGGDGMVQIWEFPKGERSIVLSVYSTIRGEYSTDPETYLKITY